MADTTGEEDADEWVLVAAAAAAEAAASFVGPLRGEVMGVEEADVVADDVGAADEDVALDAPLLDLDTLPPDTPAADADAVATVRVLGAAPPAAPYG